MAPIKLQPIKPFKLQDQTIGETAFQEQAATMLKLLVLPPCEWTAFPAGHIFLSPADAGRLFRCGLKRAWPDFLFLHGRLYGLELKSRDGNLSKTRMVRSRKTGRLRQVEGQEDVHPRLIKAGMVIGIARTLDEIIAQLQAWEIPMRRMS